jgi:uncharacterized protein involved in cysteine biosynthesis
LFVFSFVPGINVLAFVLTLMMLSFDCMDYTFDAMGLGLRDRLLYLTARWQQWAGMATSLALTLLVPGLTLLMVPGAVVGAAVIFKGWNNKRAY